MLKRVRIVIWATVVVLAGVVALTVAGVRVPGLGQRPLPLAASVGGPFELASTQGGLVSDRDLKGKPYAIFFGYTFCPDVCPTTLLDLTNAIKELGPDADRMRYVFVSVDPARDTIEQLKLYLSSFDPRIIGATGSDVQVAEIARAFRVYFEKVPGKEGYTINHTASTFLMDGGGHFHGTLSFEDKPEVIVGKLKRLIAGG
jgi:protein SCO1